MSAPTLALVPPPTLPPVPCRSWCRDGDGHIHADHLDDQACMSDVADDTMNLASSGEMTVNLVSGPGRRTGVELCIGEDRHAAVAHPTVAELRRFALAALATCDLADQERPVTR